MFYYNIVQNKRNIIGGGVYILNTIRYVKWIW